MTNICPACEEGTLVTSVSEEVMVYKNKKIVISGFEYSHCPLCGEDVVLPEQAENNDCKMVDARRRVDGRMTSTEIVSFRDRWGLTQANASLIFGGGVNAFSKYERCEVVQSQSADLLMRVLDQFQEVRDFVSSHTGVRLVHGGSNVQWHDVQQSKAGCIVEFANRNQGRLAVSAEKLNRRTNAPEWIDDRVVMNG